MRKVVVSVIVLCSAIFGQSDRGTITGTITDPAGAVVAGVPIEIKNSATGASYQAASTATGSLGG